MQGTADTGDRFGVMLVDILGVVSIFGLFDTLALPSTVRFCSATMRMGPIDPDEHPFCGPWRSLVRGFLSTCMHMYASAMRNIGRSKRCIHDRTHDVNECSECGPLWRITVISTYVYVSLFILQRREISVYSKRASAA